MWSFSMLKILYGFVFAAKKKHWFLYIFAVTRVTIISSSLTCWCYWQCVLLNFLLNMVMVCHCLVNQVVLHVILNIFDFYLRFVCITVYKFAVLMGFWWHFCFSFFSLALRDCTTISDYKSVAADGNTIAEQPSWTLGSIKLSPSWCVQLFWRLWCLV